MQSVKIDPFKIIGISVRTTNEHGKASKDIANLWEKFMAGKLLNKIPNRIDETVYSLYTDYEGNHTQPYTAILGCKVENIESVPEGMTAKVIRGGNYLKTSAKGNLMNGLIVNKWKEIWEMNLNRAFSADFEVFGEKAQNPENAEIDFLIALK